MSIFLVFLSFLLPTSFARTNITDWYIKNYETEIVVNKDSSLLITEKITADCDSLPDKHGIFRILPYEIKTDQGIIKMPVKLISITDFNGNPYKYRTINDFQNKTITWKIGDPNKTVTGENNYQIVYRVNNAIRFSNETFDEFYYNLSGNFWQIDIDNFSAKITFPEEIKKDDTQTYLYSGYQGEKTNFSADYIWLDDHTLKVYPKAFSSTGQGIALAAGQGITLSVTLPKGIFHKPLILSIITFNKNYFYYFFLWLIPLIVFIISFRIWQKYGKDPRYGKKTIISEYEVPDNLTPLEVSMLLNDFILKNDAIAATFIYFATKGLIAIEEDKKSGFILKPSKFIFHRTRPFPPELKELLAETFLFNTLFKNDQTKIVTLESFRESFRDPLTKKELIKDIRLDLTRKNLVSYESLLLRDKFLFIGVIIIDCVGTLITFFSSMNWLPFNLFVVNLLLVTLIIAIIIFLFGDLLPRITLKGQEVKWRLKGFKLYLETVEKYREQFYEKENIFEKFLPYAIVFGMTKLWITKMKRIYGEQYMNNYAPGWYISTSGLSVTPMNFDSFVTSLSHISSSISSSIGGSSGGGGGGSSGGGGGGGGGGGW